jgi:hypothetical protein
MPASGISLVDLNIWLALAFDGRVHHATALQRFSSGLTTIPAMGEVALRIGRADDGDRLT